MIVIKINNAAIQSERFKTSFFNQVLYKKLK